MRPDMWVLAGMISLASYSAFSWAAFIAVAYLSGSIPFGVLMGKARGIDVRVHGSRNIGATNVGRVLGWRWGLLCFVLDALKGAIPVAAAGVAQGLWGKVPSELSPSDQWLWLSTAVASLLGHLYSPWLGFRGGKGVATAFGTLLAMWAALTPPTLIAALVWVMSLLLTRYVSLSSIAAVVSIPITLACWAAWSAVNPIEGVREAMPMLLVAALLAALVIFKHRGNIGRLLRGEEPK